MTARPILLNLWISRAGSYGDLIRSGNYATVEAARKAAAKLMSAHPGSWATVYFDGKMETIAA
jgi:hypothetical protein